MVEVSADARAARVSAHLEKVRDRLKNTSDLMNKIGALGVAESQKAFREQRLGDISWKERYPGQSPPKVNVAGFVSDFVSGRSTPKPNRFQDRPALVDEGQRGGIWGSLTWNSGNEFARWGTNKEYARLQHEGGRTEIPVTPEAKKAIKNYFYTKKEQRRYIPVGTRVKLPTPIKEIVYEHKYTPSGMQLVRVEKVRKTEFIPADVTEEGEDVTRSDYVNKFGWLLNRKNMNRTDVLVTNVTPRPFVGITDDLEKRLHEAIRRHVAEGR